MTVHFPECRQLHNNHSEEAHTPKLTEDLWDKDIEETLEEEKIHWAINSLSAFKSPGEDGIFLALLPLTYSFQS